MNNKLKILIFIIGLLLPAQFVVAAESVTIRIHFFQGTWVEGQQGLDKVTVLTTSSDPALAELRARASKSQNEQKIAVTEALLDILDLQTVEDLFPRDLAWNGRDPSLGDTIVRKSLVFRFAFAPKWISAQKMAMRVVLFKSKEGSLGTGKSKDEEVEKAIRIVQDEKLMEKILDQALDLEIGDPVVVCIPYEDRAYFMLILLISGGQGSEKTASREANDAEPTEVQEAPKLIRQVLPAYPEKLRQQGVEGAVKLRVSVDKKGIVQHVTVVESLHPYLDYTAVQALKRWEFEPVLLKEKPVPAQFKVTVDFDPRTWNVREETLEHKEVPPTDLESASQEKLRMILDRCAGYCQKLSRLALDFICEETIKEIHYNFGDKEGGWLAYMYSPPDPPGGPVISASTPLFDPKLAEKNNLICDYLLVKKGDNIEERRILLQKDGRAMPDRSTLLEENKFSVLGPLFVPVRLLDRDRQAQFDYSLLKEEKVDQKKAFLIEAVPKSRDVSGIQGAKIWVDQSSFQILQCEIEGVPLQGYEDILEDCLRFNVEPLFTTTYLYQIERKGVLFPKRLTIRVIYKDQKGMTELKKLKVEINYKKYKIFTVETEQEIMK